MAVGQSDFAEWSGDGKFGRWVPDRHGLPSYDFSPQADIPPRWYATTEPEIELSPWHQIGNQRINVSVHEDGYAQLYASDRGLTCVTPYQPRVNLHGGGVALWMDPRGEWQWLRRSFLPPNAFQGIRFGVGYASARYELGGARIEVTHWVPDGIAPAVVTDIAVTPGRQSPLRLGIAHWFAYWFMGFDPLCTGWGRSRFGRAPIYRLLGILSRYILRPLRMTTNWRRYHNACGFRYSAEVPEPGLTLVAPSRRGSKLFDPALTAKRQDSPQVFFSMGIGPGSSTLVTESEAGSNPTADSPLAFLKAASKMPRGIFHRPVIIAHCFEPESSKPYSIRVIWGYCDQDEIAEVTRALAGETLGRSLEARGRRLFRLSIPHLPWVQREWAWHSDALQSSATYDGYAESSIVRQGSAYYYLHGIDGAPRDHAVFTIPLIYLHPGLAKNQLTATLRYMGPDGFIPYALHGYGRASGFGLYESSTDLPLAFLWALTEYLFATRDWGFLDEVHPYYPRASGRSRTVREQVWGLLRRFMEQIGIGAHGLVRSGTGDWNDFIQFHARDLRAYARRGESSYNTAMALYVLPRTAALLDLWDSSRAAVIRKFTQALHAALMDQWTGRWLLRGWDGKGHPIGQDRLFLEHHAWALVAEALPAARRETVIEEIVNRLDRPSPCGAMLLDPAARLKGNLLPPGWDTNGGIWPAVNALLSWGYGRSRSDLARSSLLKNTLCAHAQAYPGIWYGIWTAPDSYNAPYAENPGETYYYFTPTADYPASNANAHANPLLAALKLCGIEPTVHGFEIAPLLSDETFSIETPLVSLSRNKNSLRCSYHPAQPLTEPMLTFELKDPLCDSASATLRCQGEVLPVEQVSSSTIRFTVPTQCSGALRWELQAKETH